MKQLVLVTVIFASPLIAMPQEMPVSSPLLDHLAGKWLMRGTVGKQAVTHGFDAEWVLQHHYLRFHKVSPRRTTNGKVIPFTLPQKKSA